MITSQSNPSEQADLRALDRVDDDVFRLRCEHILARQDFRVEGVFIAEIFLLKLVAVDLVELVELLIRLRLKDREGSHGLGGQGSTIDEKQNPLRHLRLQQSISLIDQREGLARPRGHRDQHLPLLIGNGRLGRCVSMSLVVAELRVVVSRVGQ